MKTSKIILSVIFVAVALQSFSAFQDKRGMGTHKTANLLVLQNKLAIPTQIEIILNKAGKNRKELVKVIQHFKRINDPLKLKAAYFLIANMGQHYSVDTYLRDRIGKRYPFNEFNYHNYAESQLALKKFKEKNKLYSVKTEIADLTSIKGQMLIDNIEQAFSVKQNQLENAQSFEQFCEYTLPYRVATEPLSNWRSNYKNKFSFLLNSSRSEPKDLATLFSSDFKNWFSNTFGSEARSLLPRLSASQLLFYKKGPCEDISDLVGFAFRSQGIPVALDEVTFWATSSGRHYFNVIFDKKGTAFPVYDVSTKTFTNTPFQREPAKVIRRTYSSQKNVIANLLPIKQIPPGFMRSRNFLDVTHTYWKVRDVSVPVFVKKGIQPKYAFVSVFNQRQWRPTWWARIIKNSATFKSMSQGAVFLPQYYINGKLEQAGYPIVSGYSRQVILKPNEMLKRIVKIFPKDKYLLFRKGMYYTLHYWSKNGWTMIDTVLIKDPTIAYLQFKGVPANSLLLLLPERSESMERPFTIADDGTQQWW